MRAPAVGIQHVTRPLTRFRKRPDAAIVLGTILVFLVFGAVDPESWFQFFTMINITRYAAILGLLAIGQTIVILSREIDLSVGSVYGIVAIAFIASEPTLGVPLSLLAALMLAAAIGLLNALLVLRGGISSMIATLGALFFYRGIIYVTTGGTVMRFSQGARANWLTQAFGGQWLRLDNAFLWFMLIAVLASLVLYHSRFGNHLLAVGGDETTALARGVLVIRTKTIAFVACSLLAGLSGIVTIAQNPQTHVTLGMQLELESIAAAVIGGTQLGGGRGTILGSVLGTFFLTAVRSEMITLGAPPSWYTAFVGIALLLGATINTVMARRSGA